MCQRNASRSMNLESFPCCSRLLVELARTLFPELAFCAVGLFNSEQATRQVASEAAAEHMTGKLPHCLFKHQGGSCCIDSTIPFELLDCVNPDNLLLMCYSPEEGGCSFSQPTTTAANFPSPLISPSQGEKQQPRRDVSSKTVPKDCGICVEIFAGCARLSMAMQKLGFPALAYDHQRKSQFPVQMLDLTCPSQAAVLLQVIRENAARIVYIHAALSCGTCSAARVRKMPAFEKAGIPSPQPLRPDDHCALVSATFRHVHQGPRARIVETLSTANLSSRPLRKPRCSVRELPK